MNVLFISHDAVPYGAPKSMINIIDGLQQDVNFVVLLPYNGGIVPELKRRKIKYNISRFFWDVYDLHSFKDYLMLPLRLLRHYFFFYKTIKLITELNKIYNFDIIHTNSGVIRVGLYAAKFLRIPHVWHIREFQTKDYNLNILYGYRHFLKLLKRTEKTICVSKSIEKHFDLKENSVIYNGVLPKPSNNVFFEKEDYFIFAASLMPKKGVYDVLNAFINFATYNSTTQLFICGTGNEENNKRIEKIINDAGLQHRIKLLGYRSDILVLLEKAAACIVPSHHEAFGRITAEAMLMGCPVIGKACEGTLEIIRDDNYGFLYESEDELINAMIFVTEHKNKDIIHSKIIAAKKRSDDLFTQEQLCENILAVYKTVIKKNN